MLDILKNIGAAGSAAVITVTGIHPIDMVKTRLQVSGERGGRDYKSLGINGSMSVIMKEEGVSAFWKGIGAAWLREGSYTSLRLGLYSPIKSAMGVDSNSHFVMKFTAGSIAGALGSIVGNPFDVLKTRMMSSETLVTPNIRNTASELYKAQGITSFYRGIEANILRAMVLNGTKMSCYEQIKDTITESKLIPIGLPTQFCSAFGAGFFMAVTVAPFDMIRTKLMNQPPGVKLYTGFADCFTKIISKNGIMGLYTGFIPIWARFAPNTCLQLIIFEQVKPIFNI